MLIVRDVLLAYLQHNALAQHVCSRRELQSHGRVVVSGRLLRSADGAHAAEHADIALELLLCA